MLNEMKVQMAKGEMRAFMPTEQDDTNNKKVTSVTEEGRRRQSKRPIRVVLKLVF
jgi:hypothetical protein